MSDLLKNKESKESIFFDDYFETMDLNEDLEKFYQFINSEELNDEYEQNVKLCKIRNKNYKEYSSINILKYKELPENFSESVEEIIKLYNFINPKEILTTDYSNSININKILEKIFKCIEKLDKIVNIYLKKITEKNDKIG